ncbi:MAG: transposase [Clostridia bacterium]|nr:transposase [Clostridia bacterium]
MNEQPKRKPNRLSGYDYAQNGAYHIILCTENHVRILPEIERNPEAEPLFSKPQIRLSAVGAVVSDAIVQIERHYPCVFVDHFAVMPNHVHLLLSIQNGKARGTDKSGRLLIAPTVGRIVKQMKSYVTKQCGKSIWQKGFYDHVIRDDADYEAVWTYIDENPAKWENDEYF